MTADSAANSTSTVDSAADTVNIGRDAAGSTSAAGTAGSTPGPALAPPLPASYEQARDELASVVQTLEEGGLSLDESLALWERGQALATACERFLAGARERVEATLATSVETAADGDADD